MTGGDALEEGGEEAAGEEREESPSEEDIGIPLRAMPPRSN